MPNWINEIETPCIVADMSLIRRNIENMQRIADKNSCSLRPHIKTHKIVEIAKLQIEAGACGITCAKISEAEVMADGGITNIFVAYPIIGINRIKRAIALAKKIECLILAVDSIEGAQKLSEATSANGIDLEIRLEIDTGLRRTGVSMADAVLIAEKINMMPNLRLTGIFTFKSLVHENNPTTNAKLAGMEEAYLMSDVAKDMEKKGINIKDISVGSTPTGVTAAETGLVSEIRPGTYAFYDYMTFKEGACSYDEIAARIYATVVSTPEPNYAVIDGGTKTFPMDISIDSAPYYYPGYAVVEDNENLVLRRMNEEHGIITALNPMEATGLHVGQIISLIPIHICPAINLQNNIYLIEDGNIRSVKVDARGMLV